MNNRQGVGGKKLWLAVKDWEQWPLYLIGLTTYIPPSPPNTVCLLPDFFCTLLGCVRSL